MGSNTKGCGSSEPTENIRHRNIIVSKRPQQTHKGWGYELLVSNNNSYCGKILHFYKDGKSSMHFHVKKRETWFVSTGSFILKTINPENAKISEIELIPGNVIDIEVGMSHQLIALEESEIFEVSQPDYPNDSYRVWAGDSQ